MVKTKPNGYWNLENTLDETRKFIDEKGHLSYGKLKKNNRYDLIGAISKNGGFHEIRKLLGLKEITKAYGYWNYDNTLKDLKELVNTEIKKDGKIIKEKEEFPSSDIIRDYDNSLAIYVHKYGGVNHFRELLEFDILYTRPKDVRNWNYIEKKLREIINNEYRDKEGNIIKKSGEFPTQKQFSKIGKIGIENAIKRYHGGLHEARRKFGFSHTQVPRNYWTHERIEEEIKKIISMEIKEDGKVVKKPGEFPSRSQIGIVNKKLEAILTNKNEDGFRINAIREEMGYKIARHSNGYYDSFENLKKDLEPIIKEYNTLPPENELERRGYGNLIGGIYQHGGIRKVREKLGMINKRKGNGYYKNFDNFKAELENVIATEYHDKAGKLIKAKGDFPTQHQLSFIGKSSLTEQAKYHGGMTKVREILGFPITQNSLEQTIDIYIGARK